VYLFTGDLVIRYISLLRQVAVNFVADHDSIYNVKVTIAGTQLCESSGVPHGKDQAQVACCCYVLLYNTTLV